MLWCRRSTHLASDVAAVQSTWVLSGMWLAVMGWQGAFASIAVCLLVVSLWMSRSPRPPLLAVQPSQY